MRAEDDEGFGMEIEYCLLLFSLQIKVVQKRPLDTDKFHVEQL